MSFSGKTVLITGASEGIGRACAIEFAQKGADLILIDINYEKLGILKKRIEEYKRDVLIFECDVSDEERVNEVIKESLSHFGKIDVLVNNAAVWRCWNSFVDTSVEEWKRFFDINVMGVVYMTKAVLPGMLENGWGRVINIASVAGVYGNANMVHYSATKGAVISMTKALAKEVTDKGVLVNAVSPGSVSDGNNPDIDSFQESELAFIGRTGTGRENANLICFLASDEASYISAQNIQIDGCRKKI